jgi:hypothetical protein
MRRRGSSSGRPRTISHLKVKPLWGMAAPDRLRSSRPLHSSACHRAHTRTSNPYQLLYDVLGIEEPEQPRTKPTCCDPEGQAPIDADLAAQLEEGLRELARGTRSIGKARKKRR